MHATEFLGDIRDKLVLRKAKIGYLLLTSLLFLFIYRNLSIFEMFAYADLYPFPRSPDILWKRFAFVWQNEYLGFPLPESSFQVFVGIIIFMLGDPIVAQKVLLLSAMPCAVICMYVFIGRFLTSDTSRFVASILYGLNPIIAGRFVNGGPLDVLFQYALLPLFWLLLIKMLNGRKIRDILLFAALFGIVGGRVYAFFWAIIPFTIILLLWRARQKGYRNKSFLSGAMMVFLSISLGFLLILPDVLLTFRRNQTLVPQYETLIETVDWCYSKATPINLVRLAGNGGDLMMHNLGYNGNGFWTLFGLIIPSIAFFSIFLAKKEKKEYVFLFLTIVIATMLFILLTRLEFTYPLIQAFPMFFSLKNPVKLMYPLSLALCSLFAIGLDGIIEHQDTIFGWCPKTSGNLRRKVQVAILNASVFVLIFAYLFPVLGGGTVGLNEVYGTSYFIPTEYETVLDWINEQRQSGEFFRTLWLPYNFTTQIRLFTADPHNVGLRSGAAWLNMPNIDFVWDIFKTICKGNVENFGEILKILDVKYVIVDLSDQTTDCMIIERQVTPWIVGNATYFVNFMEQQNDLDELFRVGNLVIYENKRFAVSHFSIYDSLIFLTGPSLNSSITSELTPNLQQNLETTTTGFDNVGSYETPSIPPDSFVPNLLILSNVNGFNSSKNLVVFEKGLSHNEILEALNISSIIAFSHPTIGQLKEYANYVRDQKLLVIFEAETLRATEGRLLLNRSMSNGEAIELDEGVLCLEFYAPISGYYRIGFTGSFENISIFLDDLNLDLRNQHETEASFLEEGNYTLRLTGEGVILDQIQIFSAKSVGDINNMFETEHNPRNEITSIESTKGSYTIKADFEESSFLVLGESYHPDWKAYLHNENLEHFRAFGWCNAFYMPEIGETEIEILFEQQELRDFSITIWVSSWEIVLVAFFLCYCIEKLYYRGGD